MGKVLTEQELADILENIAGIQHPDEIKGMCWYLTEYGYSSAAHEIIQREINEFPLNGAGVKLICQFYGDQIGLLVFDDGDLPLNQKTIKAVQQYLIQNNLAADL